MQYFGKIISTFALVMCTLIGVSAQMKNAKTEKVTVYGNCGMCKSVIEKAGSKKNVSEVVWDENTKIAVVTYDETKTDLDKILKKIARAGYDNEKHRANDLSYESLHACCQYERKK